MEISQITQIAIMIFGGLAIWLVGRKEHWSRWGFIVGLIGQPFWFYTTYVNEQWGIFTMCFIYTYSWGQGIWNHWIKPWMFIRWAKRQKNVVAFDSNGKLVTEMTDEELEWSKEIQADNERRLWFRDEENLQHKINVDNVVNKNQ